MMIEQYCIDQATASENEVCGLIINSVQYFHCRNIHPDPGRYFRINDTDWLEAEAAGEITAVFHSHPGNRLVLSAGDRSAQISTDLEWWLASDGQLRKFRPVPYLLGREFLHGSMDCYTLFRDAYHLCGIDLPDFERANGWWLRGENLYLKNLPANGFYQVTAADIQPGDVVIRRAFPESDPCHAMIYLGDGDVIHHDCSGRLSRREKFKPSHQKLLHSIWRHTECSRLNLRGIYEDISAASLYM